MLKPTRQWQLENRLTKGLTNLRISNHDSNNNIDDDSNKKFLKQWPNNKTYYTNND